LTVDQGHLGKWKIDRELLEASLGDWAVSMGAEFNSRDAMKDYRGRNEVSDRRTKDLKDSGVASQDTDSFFGARKTGRGQWAKKSPRVEGDVRGPIWERREVLQGASPRGSWVTRVSDKYQWPRGRELEKRSWRSSSMPWGKRGKSK
jgi:hypothetical protein